MVVSVVEPAVIVPDPGTWALWGIDVESRGLGQAPSPAGASVLALPSTVPAALSAPVRSAWDEMPPPRRWVALEGSPLDGVPAAAVIEGEDAQPGGVAEGQDEHGHQHHEGGHEGHEHHEEPGDHEAHGHHDMMEITGEPSRDGLVMESIPLEHGPLAPGLPGGLVLTAELDGDVVCSCDIHALSAESPVDPLAPAASAAVLRAAKASTDDEPLESVIAIERERALSHLCWLSGLGVVLGWQELSDRARGTAVNLIDPGAVALEVALPECERLLGMLQGSRRLARRTRGRGSVTPDLATARGLRGPSARASGLADDPRADSDVYRRLGFSPRTEQAGDAEARVLQRAGEALDSLRLIAVARETTMPTGEPGPAAIEGPRGPLHLADGHVRTEGADAARQIAGELAAGLEWASALAVVASFDLSPWEPTR